eukprot:457838-Ditylum_brightwellii.AAC.1
MEVASVLNDIVVNVQHRTNYHHQHTPPCSYHPPPSHSYHPPPHFIILQELTFKNKTVKQLKEHIKQNDLMEKGSSESKLKQQIIDFILSKQQQMQQSTYITTPSKVSSSCGDGEAQDTPIVCFSPLSPTHSTSQAFPSQEPVLIPLEHHIPPPSRIMNNIKQAPDIKIIINSFEFSRKEDLQREIVNSSLWKP